LIPISSKLHQVFTRAWDVGGIMTTKTILRILTWAVVPLLVPAIGMQVSTGWKWGPGDFLFAWLLFASSGFAYQFATRKTGGIAYRIAAGLAIATVLVITWMNLAVGIIGGEDNPANLLYAGVVAVGVVGAVGSRFQARGMARTLFAMAGAVALVPVLALIIWRPDFSPGVMQVFGLNAFFAILFAGSALIFMKAVKAAAKVSAEG
jgi:hypothetical protein